MSNVIFDIGKIAKTRDPEVADSTSGLPPTTETAGRSPEGGFRNLLGWKIWT
jgi:hypothetical protein